MIIQAMIGKDHFANLDHGQSAGYPIKKYGSF